MVSKNSNIQRWHILFILATITWVIGSYFFLHHKPKEEGTIIVEETITNLFPTSIVQDKTFNNAKFRIKSKYEIGEVVFIKFFRIQAVILESTSNDNYTILYRDRNHVLQKITLSHILLLTPPDGIWNTFPIDN